MNDNKVYNPYTGEYEEDYIVGYGPDVYLEISVFGKFWKDLDEIFSIYVSDWEKLDA